MDREGSGIASGLEKFAVGAQFPPGEQRLGVAAVGDAVITGAISSVVAKYKGTVVTEVPAGENFDIEVTYSANSPNQSALWGWLTSITIVSTDGSFKKALNETWLPTQKSTGTRKVHWTFGPMPSAPVSFRVTPWANGQLGNPLGTPPEPW